MVLAGEATPQDALPQLKRGIAQLRYVFGDAECSAHLDAAARAVEENRYYPALKALRALLTSEQVLLDRAAGGSA